MRGLQASKHAAIQTPASPFGRFGRTCVAHVLRAILGAFVASFPARLNLTLAVVPAACGPRWASALTQRLARQETRGMRDARKAGKPRCTKGGKVALRKRRRSGISFSSLLLLLLLLQLPAPLSSSSPPPSASLLPGSPPGFLSSRPHSLLFAGGASTRCAPSSRTPQALLLLRSAYSPSNPRCKLVDLFALRFSRATRTAT